RPPPFPYTPLFRSPPASNRRFSRRTCRTVIRRAAATWAFVSRPPHSAFNSPGRCSSFRLNVKVSIEGGPFHGAVRGGHFHVAAAVSQVGLDAATDSVLFFLTGGVSFCSGVDRARGSFGEPKVTPPFLVYTLSDVTSAWRLFISD